MKSNISQTNTSFSLLKGSCEFLDTILNNITSCVLLMNDKMELQAYNNSLKTIFSNKKDEDILYQRCGEVIGCSHSVEEKKNCGTTSQCDTCELRVSALNSYITNEPIYKDKISRYFYTTDYSKTLKHLQFSTRLFIYEKEKYIIMIIEDISTLVNQKEQIMEQLGKIKILENQ